MTLLEQLRRDADELADAVDDLERRYAKIIPSSKLEPIAAGLRSCVQALCDAMNDCERPQ